MKTIGEIFKDHNASGMACEYGYSVEVVSIDLAIKIAKEYAHQFIDIAIDKSEICCNNFYPTISGAELLRIKELI